MTQDGVDISLQKKKLSSFPAHWDMQHKLDAAPCIYQSNFRRLYRLLRSQRHPNQFSSRRRNLLSTGKYMSMQSVLAFETCTRRDTNI